MSNKNDFGVSPINPFRKYNNNSNAPDPDFVNDFVPFGDDDDDLLFLDDLGNRKPRSMKERLMARMSSNSRIQFKMRTALLSIVVCTVLIAVAIVLSIIIAFVVREVKNNHDDDDDDDNGNHDKNPFAFTDSEVQQIDAVLTEAMQNKVFPGCTALVANNKGILYSKAFGRLSYDPDSPAMTLDTLFDIASLTKIVTATTAAAQFYDRNELDLDALVGSDELLGAGFNNNGKESITVRNLLLHDAGFPPDATPEYWEDAFGCIKPNLSLTTFECQQRIFESVLSQSLAYPVGSKSVYSDISMITMMYVIGKLARDKGYISREDVAATPCFTYNNEDGSNDNALWKSQCYFEAYVNKYIINALGMTQTSFNPGPPSIWSTRVAPAWNETFYRDRVIQGQVSDRQAFHMGGVSGHAGIFSTVGDLYKFLTPWQQQQQQQQQDDDHDDDDDEKEATPLFLSQDTIREFTTCANVSMSTRALGWDTFADGSIGTCGTLSPSTYYHTGYTGTCFCNDPERGLFTILLTNRVYPNQLANSAAIFNTRKRFASTVQQIYDSKKKNNNN